MEATLKAAWSPDTVGTRFSATVSPAGAGLLSVRVAAGAAKDGSGNPIQEPSQELQVHLHISSPAASQNAPHDEPPWLPEPLVGMNRPSSLCLLLSMPQVRVGGGQVVVADAEGGISVLQPASGNYGAPSATWKTGSTGTLLAAMPDGRLLAASENGTTVQVTHPSAIFHSRSRSSSKCR